MTASERRYDDEEVREIFGRATSQERSRLPAPAGDHSGFTLAELQEIGEEVGVSPTAIANAAAALDATGSAVVAPRQSLAGAPVTVGRTVALPRAPTDHEWDVLLTEIRRTFGAQGSTKSYGGHREWRNGRLVVAIEPTVDGTELRMGTTKTNGVLLAGLGSLAVLGSVLLAVVMTLTGATGEDLLLPAFYGIVGLGMLGANRLRLPPWAAEREAQMEHLGERAHALLGAPSATDDGMA